MTGAARGLGSATALVLARQGWRLVLTDRCADDPGVPYPLGTRAELEETARRCRAHTEVVTAVADVRRSGDLDAAVAVAQDSFGGLDAAVAVAGVIVGGPSGWEQDEASWATLLEVDLGGVWRLARAAVPALLARRQPRSGRFIAVSSAAGRTPLPRLAGYTAAKHAVVGYVGSLARDLAGTGITANVVCPGSMDTAMLTASAAIYDLADRTAFAAHHDLGRLLDPGEVAELIGWLCSPAAGGLTGAVLSADGGFHG